MVVKLNIKKLVVGRKLKIIEKFKEGESRDNLATEFSVGEYKKKNKLRIGFSAKCNCSS